MKERNLYTMFLATVGVVALIIAFGTIAVSEQPWELLLVILGVSMIGLFPIKLPNHLTYSFGHIPALYLLLVYGWKFAMLPCLIAIVSIILQNFSTYSKNLKSRLFRIFVSSGMYFFSYSSIYLVIHHSDVESPALLAIISTILIDLFTFTMNKTIQMSLLGRMVFTKLRWKAEPLPLLFILLSSVLLYQIYVTDDYSNLAREAFMVTLILYILSFISNMAVRLKFEADELKTGYELTYTAARQLFISLDLQGRITEANTIAEQILERPHMELKDRVLWELESESGSSIIGHFQDAVKGTVQESELALLLAEDRLIKLPVSFVPIFKNMKVNGVYLVGRITMPSNPDERRES